MKRSQKIRQWLYEQRTSARLAFVLRIISMGLSSVLSLIWTRLLLGAMGGPLYGLYLSFQAIPRLGGLGDFGISGAVGLRTGQMIGRNEKNRLIEFLAAARGLFMLIAPLLGIIFLILSPFLPNWLNFETLPGSGSLVLLFQTGAITLFLTIAGGYIYNLNAGTNNIVWPIIPTFLIGQAGILMQWFLAKEGYPLWIQNCPSLLSATFSMMFVWWALKVAHPELAALRPLKVDFHYWRELLGTSGWIYLYAIGSAIFTTTDRLLVNAGFGSAAVPSYVVNYKSCELALQFVFAACFATQAKINQWIANRSEDSQSRARQGVQRLFIFQSTTGFVFALGYLAFNNLFVFYWLGPSFQVPSALQWAFALTLAITSGGDTGVQTAGLCGSHGLRQAGIAIGVTGLINLSLSFFSMHAGSLVGIAYATVFAQSCLSLYLGWRMCRYLKLRAGIWMLRSFLFPMIGILVAAAFQASIGSKTWIQAGTLAGIYFLLALGFAAANGVTLKFLREELAILRGLPPR